MSAQLTDSDYELLSAYIDGELSDSERIALERRLEAEPQLRRELSLLRQTVTLLRELPELQAPRNFTLDERAAPPLRVIKPQRRLLTLNRLTAVAAMLLVVCFAGYVLVSQFSPSVGTTGSQNSLQNGDAVALAPSSTSLTPPEPLVQMGGDETSATDGDVTNETQLFGYVTPIDNQEQADSGGIVNDGVNATEIAETDDSRDEATMTDILPADSSVAATRVTEPPMPQPETGVGNAGGMGGGIPPGTENQPSESFGGTLAFATTPSSDQQIDSFSMEAPPTSQTEAELTLPSVAQEESSASSAAQLAPSSTQVASGEVGNSGLADTTTSRKASDILTLGLSPAVIVTSATIIIAVAMTYSLLIN